MKQIFAGRKFGRAQRVAGAFADLIGLVARELARGRHDNSATELFRRFEALLEQHRPRR